jgi:hypothetical protein
VVAVVEEMMQGMMERARYVTEIIMMLPSVTIATQDLCKALAMAMAIDHHHHNSHLNTQTPMAMEIQEHNVHPCLMLC